MNERMNEWTNEWKKERTNEWMNEWMNERMSEWMNEWTKEWVSEWMNEWMNERKNKWMNEWVNKWMNERTNEWMNEWANEWMNEWMGGIYTVNTLRLIQTYRSWLRLYPDCASTENFVSIFTRLDYGTTAVSGSVCGLKYRCFQRVFGGLSMGDIVCLEAVRISPGTKRMLPNAPFWHLSRSMVMFTGILGRW
jgi:hypothetical protein